jgi:ubiquinone/menaquinone biosynthesis C-methylase UbiE
VEERLLEVFMDVQRGLPRQGPGNDASTLQALQLCGALPDRPRVLDIGCGPGMQTLALARALQCPVVAVDTAQEYLDQLRASVTAAGLQDTVSSLVADMHALPFSPASFDLIWSEGAAYIMGFDNALNTWRDLLAPKGRIAVTELAWTTDDPPTEVAEFFGQEYPAMKSVDQCVATMDDEGYDVLGHFVLPDAAWWDDYYEPLQHKLPALREKYAHDEEALAVVQSTTREIEMRRRFPATYGYVFLIGRLP